MADETTARRTPSQRFDSSLLDTSLLVGHSVVLFTEQFPGRMLRSRVLSTSEGQVEIETGSKFDLIENLVNHQSVVLQFEYRGEEISVKALLKRSSGGRCFLKLEDEVTPLQQRRFVRRPFSVPVRLAAFPKVTFRPAALNRLRWMATDTVNISSGGTMVVVPAVLHRDVLLMMNLEVEPLTFPKLLLGRVRHCFQAENQYYHVGVEFVTSDEARRMFPPAKSRELPPSIFSYSREDRDQLNRQIIRINRESFADADTDTDGDRSDT